MEQSTEILQDPKVRLPTSAFGSEYFSLESGEIKRLLRYTLAISIHLPGKSLPSDVAGARKFDKVWPETGQSPTDCRVMQDLHEDFMHSVDSVS